MYSLSLAPVVKMGLPRAYGTGTAIGLSRCATAAVALPEAGSTEESARAGRPKPSARASSTAASSEAGGDRHAGRGIAHDFNNILSAILGYGEMVQKGAGEGTAMRRQIDAAMPARLRAKALAKRFLAEQAPASA